MIEIYEGDLYIADPWPAAYIKSIDAVVLSDLHLGIEGALANEGIYLPTSISESTIRLVKRILDDVGPTMVIFNGDVKHGFGLLNTSEWIHVRNLFRELREGYEVLVVRGNHDNYLGVVLDRLGIPFVERYDHGPYSIIHGHTKPDNLGDVVIIGHEHPSISLRDDVGVKYKFKCFLWGPLNDRWVLVLPSVGELATGATISIYEDERLSPLMRGVDISRFKAYAVVPGETVQEFPVLKDFVDYI